MVNCEINCEKIEKMKYSLLKVDFSYHFTGDFEILEDGIPIHWDLIGKFYNI